MTQCAVRVPSGDLFEVCRVLCFSADNRHSNLDNVAVDQANIRRLQSISRN